MLAFRNILLAALLTAASAQAVTTGEWHNVMMQTGQTGLYTNGAAINGYFEPAYAGFKVATDPQHVAASYSLTNGTVESGTITNTWATGASYLLIGESGQFDLRFTFSGITGNPSKIEWEGYYDGNPAHQIGLYMWNYSTAGWTTINADAFTVANGSDFSVVEFVPIPMSNYVASGVSTVRIFHTSSPPIAAHDFATDYLFILEEQLNLTTAGVYYAFTDFEQSVTPQNFVFGTTGTATAQVAGVYAIDINGSFTGSTNTTFEASIFTNGVNSNISFHRRIGSGGDVGSAYAGGMLPLAANDQLSVQIKSDKDDAFLSFYHFSGNVQKIGN